MQLKRIMQVDAKRALTNLIGTHDGNFHCDEALACYLLKQLPEYKQAGILRTRDASKLDSCDVVVDVGGVFDAEKKRFDHHQRSFNETFSSLVPSKPWSIRLSSAGLVYVYYGKQVLSEIVRENGGEMSDEEREKLIEILYDKIYEGFVQEIDAIDNGINIADDKRYNITTNISSRVGYLNASWNGKNFNENDQFEKAMNLVGSELKDRVLYYVNDWWPARSIVEKAIRKRFDVHSSGSIIKLDTFCPWKSHLFNIEKELDCVDKIKYILYEDKSGSWRVQCVPLEENSFSNRKSLKEEWCGLRDEELCEKSGISSCIFIHASGFIGGAKTYESALKLALGSLM